MTLRWHVLGIFAAVYVLVAFGTGHASAEELTPAQVQGAQYAQHLGQPVPLDLPFRDENGHLAALGTFFGARPVVLSLNYYHCQYVCPIEENGLISALNGVSLTLGRDYNLVTVSIDPRDGPSDASQVKAVGLRAYDRSGDADGWHVLTGDADSIQRLTRALGFQYVYDTQNDDYAHPVGVVVITPGGMISQYVYGLDFSATDLRGALIHAGGGAIGTLFDKAVLICYQYDPLTGEYTTLALNVMRLGGGVGVLGMVVFLGWLWRDELRVHRRD